MAVVRPVDEITRRVGICTKVIAENKQDPSVFQHLDWSKYRFVGWLCNRREVILSNEGHTLGLVREGDLCIEFDERLQRDA